MKKDDLLDAIGMIDEKYISEAARLDVEMTGSEMPDQKNTSDLCANGKAVNRQAANDGKEAFVSVRKKRRKLWTSLACAACLCLVVGGVWSMRGGLGINGGGTKDMAAVEQEYAEDTTQALDETAGEMEEKASVGEAEEKASVGEAEEKASAGEAEEKASAGEIQRESEGQESSEAAQEGAEGQESLDAAREDLKEQTSAEHLDRVESDVSQEAENKSSENNVQEPTDQSSEDSAQESADQRSKDSIQELADQSGKDSVQEPADKNDQGGKQETIDAKMSIWERIRAFFRNLFHLK